MRSDDEVTRLARAQANACSNALESIDRELRRAHVDNALIHQWTWLDHRKEGEHEYTSAVTMFSVEPVGDEGRVLCTHPFGQHP